MRGRRPHCRYGTLTLLGCLLAIAIPPEASAETCNITSVPPGPVKLGAFAELSANCTGAPVAIQWDSSLADCSPSYGPVTVCNFPAQATAHVSVQASYAGCVGPAFDTYDMVVNAAAPPTCLVTAAPPGPLQPGAWAGLTAQCSGSPAFITWSSCLGNCSPGYGAATECSFPSAGTAVVTASAAYGDGFGGSFYVNADRAVQVTPTAAPSCYITANPKGPLLPGAWAEFAANCSGAPAAISWNSCFANCAPLSGPETVCSFPAEADATITVAASYPDRVLQAFDAYTMPIRNSATPTCLVTANPSGPVQPGAFADFTAHCSGNPVSVQWFGSMSGLGGCMPAFGTSTSCYFPFEGTSVILARTTYEPYPGNFWYDHSTYAMAVTPTAPPNCNIVTVPQGPLKPGAWADVYARCTGNPASYQWASSLASCTPSTGAETVCHFAGPGIASLDVNASYASGVGGCFTVTDHLPVVLSSSAADTCSITASPASPVRAGDSSRLSANCTGSPLAIQWSGSWGAASCGPPSGATMDCVFPAVGGSTFVVQTSYAGSASAADSFVMRVNPPLSACTYGIAPYDLSGLAIGGGRYFVNVYAAEGCPVTATLFQPWVQVVGIAPGTSSTTVSLDVHANPGPPRATSIVLAGRLFLITQLGQ